MKIDKKNKRLRLLDLERDGKGVSKNKKDVGYGLKGFFLSVKDNFGKLVYVNIFMVLGNFPMLFLIAVLSGFSKADTFVPMHDTLQNSIGIFLNQNPDPFMMSFFALDGMQYAELVYTPLSYVLLAIGSLSIFTFGIVNVGTAYILRNIAKHEPVFVWSDFIYAIKRNWKQALPYGILDLGIMGILGFNIYSMFMAERTFFTSFMLWGSIAFFVVYFFMRYYMYVQMVTFKLSVFKMLKNSMIFALLGFKRNLVAMIGMAFFVVIEFMFLFGAGGILIPFGVAAPLAFFLAFFAYMKVYAAYYKIKVVMIDPYLAEHPEEAPEVSDEDEVIMHDDVTERERLEEIKRRNGLI